MNNTHLSLGYAGLIPFVGLSIATIMGYPQANFALLSYAMLIASFLGGTLWLSSVENKLPGHTAIVSNILMLAAWVILLLHNQTGIYYFAAALYAVLIVYERRFFKTIHAPEYLQLRTILSVVVTVCMLTVAVYFHVGN